LKGALARWADQGSEYCAAAVRQTAVDLYDLEHPGTAEPEPLRRLQDTVDPALSPIPEPGTALAEAVPVRSEPALVLSGPPRPRSSGPDRRPACSAHQGHERAFYLPRPFG